MVSQEDLITDDGRLYGYPVQRVMLPRLGSYDLGTTDYRIYFGDSLYSGSAMYGIPLMNRQNWESLIQETARTSPGYNMFYPVLELIA